MPADPTIVSDRVTYGELLGRNADIAAHLTAHHGISRGDIVAMEAMRSARTPELVLGILRSGAAYLPLSPHQPVERLVAMLGAGAGRPALLLLGPSPPPPSPPSNLARAAETCAIPTATLGAAGEWRAPAQSLPPPPPCPTSPDDVAYVLYTSGSTGPPKGVEVTHRNAVSFLGAMQRGPARVRPGDVLTCVHELLFDFSVWEMFGALCNGAAVCIVPASVYLSPPDLIELCDALGVTVLSQTPAAFAALELEDRLLWKRAGAPLRSLRAIVFAGDKLDFGRLSTWIDRHGDESPRLYNCYGITETSVFSTCRRITGRDVLAARGVDYPHASLIGRPLGHNDFVVLDGERRDVPPGACGELYIGGLAVAKGYLGQEALTRERFGPLCEGGQRYFRTGDLVRRTAAGEFDFLGRVDHQLKVRGFRVEAFEVEQAVLAHEAVSQAVAVVARGRLVVFFTVGRGEPPAKKELDALARRRLPDYMVPQEYICLAEDDVPKTPNRKVDRKRLEREAGARGRRGGGDLLRV